MDLSITSLPKLPNRFDPALTLQSLGSKYEWVGLRFIQESSQTLIAEDGQMRAPTMDLSRGVQIEVRAGGQIAYASTSDLSPASIEATAQQAFKKAQLQQQHGIELSSVTRPAHKGTYSTHKVRGLDTLSRNQIMDVARQASSQMKNNPLISKAMGMVRYTHRLQHWVTSDGADITQEFDLWASDFNCIATQGSQVERRSFSGGQALCYQGGSEILDLPWILEKCKQNQSQAIELLSAPNCPSKVTDLVLAPDQMLLQIHESIGHPLELDRILGDERNYAGWSFVQPKDFGTLQYGSKLLNVVFDPTAPTGFATYAFDDEGLPATREYLIKDGLLLRPLGGAESQFRSGLPGVANSRTSSWSRAPIDRMANIDVLPGNSTFDQIISNVEDGIYMISNRSWSIDDYRNKFQFGCEYAREIKNGKLGQVYKSPNYRGECLNFWRALEQVGDASTFERYGSPYCGKGEPSQIIRVSHASPTCHFKNIEIFGGA